MISLFHSLFINVVKFGIGTGRRWGTFLGYGRISLIYRKKNTKKTKQGKNIQQQKQIGLITMYNYEKYCISFVTTEHFHQSGAVITIFCYPTNL